MNKLMIEKEIIKKFIVKNKQERIIWELQSDRKRGDVFWRFADPNILKKKCKYEICFINRDEMKKYFGKVSTTGIVYFISESCVGELLLSEAIRKIYDGEICIMYCGKGIGYYQGEEEYGKRPRYLLKDNIS